MIKVGLGCNFNKSIKLTDAYKEGEEWIFKNYWKINLYYMV